MLLNSNLQKSVYIATLLIYLIILIVLGAQTIYKIPNILKNIDIWIRRNYTGGFHNKVRGFLRRFSHIRTINTIWRKFLSKRKHLFIFGYHLPNLLKMPKIGRLFPQTLEHSKYVPQRGGNRTLLMSLDINLYHVFLFFLQWPITYFITFATREIAHSNTMFERMSQSLIKPHNKVDCAENM